MFNNNFSFCYSVSSRIHRLSSIYKIISIVILIICMLFCDSAIDMVVVNLYIFVIMLWSNVSFRLYWENINVFRSLLLLIFLFVSVFSLSVLNGALWCLKIFDVIIYLIIIAVTTSLNDMVNGVYRIFKPFKKFVNINVFSLNLALYFNFFGICYSEYDRIKLSKRLRGVRFGDMKFFDRLEYFFSCISPVIRRSVDRIGILRKNMYIKNYGISDYISDYRLNKWRKTDTMLLIVSIFMMIVIFIY